MTGRSISHYLTNDDTDGTKRYVSYESYYLFADGSVECSKWSVDTDWPSDRDTEEITWCELKDLSPHVQEMLNENIKRK